MRIRDRHPWMLRLVFGFLCLVLVFLLVTIWSQTRYGSLGTIDFIEYWSAGQLLRQGENPYDFEKLLAVQKRVGWPHGTPLVMWNPPWVLVWLFPLLFLDFPSASLAWVGVNFAIILICSTLIWSFTEAHRPKSKLFLAWIGGFFFAPALMTLGLGQVSGLNLLGIVLFVAWVRRSRYFAAGLALALTTAKIHIVYLCWPFVLWWVFKERRWTVAAGFSVAVLGSAGILTWLRGEWVTDYRAALSAPPLYWATPTLGGILRELLGVPWQQAQYVPPLASLLIVLVYLAWRRPDVTWTTMIGPLLLLSVITSAFGWSYDQVVLMIPFLEVFSGLMHEGVSGTGKRVALATSLVVYSGALFVMNWLRTDELYKFWLPWLLALTYWVARSAGPAEGRQVRGLHR